MHERIVSMECADEDVASFLCWLLMGNGSSIIFDKIPLFCPALSLQFC